MPVLLRWLLRLGPLNPIALRLVKNGSRRTKHLYARAGYLGVLILVLLWTLIANTSSGALSYRELAAAGSSSFVWIAYLQIGLICVIAPVFMAGAIAQESSAATWDTLLTTPMTQSEIVLGNLLGRLFFVISLLFCSLPLFALTQYFGGVPGRSIFASYLIATGAALVVGAIAIALAVSRLAGRRAVFTFYVSVVTYLATTWAVDAFLRTRGLGAGAAGAGVTWLTAFNPFLSLTALLNPTQYPRASAGTHTGLAALFLEKPVTAWCVLSGVLSAGLAVVSTVTVRAGGWATLGQGTSGVPWHRRVLGLGSKGAEHRPPRSVGSNPIAWREATARNATLGRIVARWSFIALGLVTGLAVIIAFDAGAIAVGTYRFVLSALVWTQTAVITLVAINMASTAISREREDGTLDLLLTTPITPGMYLAGKLRGLVAYLLPMIAVPVVTLLVAGVHALSGGLVTPGSARESVLFPAGGGSLPQYPFNGTATPNAMVTSVPVVLPEGGLLAGVLLVPFIAFCVMIGLQWSLKSKGTLASVVGAVGVIAAVTGVVGLCAWNAGPSVEVLGPALAGVSPASLLHAVTSPVAGMDSTTLSNPDGLTAARVALAVGVVLAAGIYIGVVFALRAALVRNFDVTVRKLAGQK